MNTSYWDFLSKEVEEFWSEILPEELVVEEDNSSGAGASRVEANWSLSDIRDDKNDTCSQEVISIVWALINFDQPSLFLFLAQ